MSTTTTTQYVTLEEYERMVDEDVFGDRAPIELLDGELVPKMTQKPPHCTSDDACGNELARVLPTGWYIRAAKPVRLPPQDSEPEPDRCVARGSRLDYETRHPGPPDIALVVEVSYRTLAQDRGKKQKNYATAGIPIYWIINIHERQVEVYTQPQPGIYGSRMDYKTGERFPVIIDGNLVGEIAVADVLPQPTADDGE
jgi:Uma2 family endonuclease